MRNTLGNSLVSIVLFSSFALTSILPRAPNAADIKDLAPPVLPDLILELHNLSCPAFDIDPNEDQGYNLTLPPNMTQSAAPITTSAASSSATTTDPPTTTSTTDGRPSCIYHGPDPDAFAPEGYCICASSITLSVLTPTPSNAPESSSCAYLTLPPATATFSRSLPPPQSSNCYIHQQIGINQGSDQEIPGCVPTGHPKQTITLAKEKIAAGNLTGMAFHDEVLSILKPKCPDVAQGSNGTCDTSGATIDNVPYVEKDGDEMEEATVTLTVISSYYTDNIYRDMMLVAAARAYNASASGKNCGTLHYNSCNGGASEKPNPLDVSPHGKNCGTPILQCNVPELITVQVVDGGGPVGLMNVGFSFKMDGWSVFQCEFVAGLMDVIYSTMAVLDPASAPEDGTLIAETQSVCEEVEKLAAGISR